MDVAGPRDWEALQRLTTECRAGVRLRGALAARLLAELRLDVLLAVFSEIHHASHYLWHTLDPGCGALRAAEIPSLVDVYREVDRQIGQLIDLAGPEATVLIFSLHGMRATRGVPMVLDPLLRALAMASGEPWWARTWSEQRQWAVSTIKQAVPNPLRRLYRKATSGALRPPQPRVRLPYDWSRTVAFPVPTDQHGWIRVNLKGREVGGIIDRKQYDEVCTRLDQVLRGLTTERGSKVVKDVLRMSGDTGSPPEHLPDLIVHWDDHALANPLRIAAPRISARATGTTFTGQHAARGFFILRPASGQLLSPGSSVTAQELHRLIRAGLNT
jgi:predicted AlkP superfamily phosphohydrolase/phosphomutase